MATKPTPGGSDGTYGTELNEFLDIGHDADGTHKKSQMLTDMGWVPTSYAGEESITYPNGLIFKQGTESVAATTIDTVTYAVAFPTGFKTAQVTMAAVGAAAAEVVSCEPTSGSEKISLRVYNNDNSTRNIFWQAWGY